MTSKQGLLCFVVLAWLFESQAVQSTNFGAKPLQKDVSLSNQQSTVSAARFHSEHIEQDKLKESVYKSVQKALKSLVFGYSVALTPKIFTEQSKLIIERRDSRNLNGRLASGRKMSSSYLVFSLVTDGQACFVQRDDNLEKVLLEKLKCSYRE